MYNHNKIEKKWQQYWDDHHTYQFIDDPEKPKYYVLDMFPYPSGKGLHVGHPKGYTATDVVSRFKRLQGFNVLHPIGWDAFGLPAEQYALDTNNDPRTFTAENINHFRSQLRSLGFDYDYDKEVNTTDPRYYKWTQWIFEQLYRNGLAELKDVDVNWCEGLKTVLANEELVLDAQGNLVSERGGYPVVKKPMKQWVLKITRYADKLLAGLDNLDWPESLKNLQRKWIGRTQGYELPILMGGEEEKIFVKDPLQLLGASFLVLPANSPLLPKWGAADPELAAYLERVQKTSDRERAKTGVVGGVKIAKEAQNPLTGQMIAVVVSDRATHPHLANPADQTDILLGERFGISLPKVFTEGVVTMPGAFFGQGVDWVRHAIQERLGTKLTPTTRYKLKDWIFSRQRYWGEPFPLYFDEAGNIHLVDHLPLCLPETDHFQPSADGRGPLASLPAWMNFTKDGQTFHHDSNTMPQWAGSCWYYLGYLMKQPDGSYIPLDDPRARKIFERWMPVDLYIGGQEHAVLHLLYARFWYNFLYDIGVVPNPEPFQKVVNQGMILGPNGEKMSKSRGNVINPDEIIRTHGADTLRIYEMFMGPLTASLAWSDASLDGIRRWLDRVNRVYTDPTHFKLATVEHPGEQLRMAYNEFVEKTTQAIETHQFNMAISHMMVFINQVVEARQFYHPYMFNFLVCLSPFAPHLAEELAHNLEPNLDSITHAKWPTFEKVVHQTVTVPVMVDNKLRDTLTVRIDEEREGVIERARALPKVAKFLAGRTITKVVYVPQKIINFNTKA